MKLNRQQIQTLIRMVANTKTQELDCDEMMRALTAYADKLARGEVMEVTDAATIQHHLEICPECSEEFEFLRRIVAEGNLRED